MTLDWRVLGFAVALAIVTCALFGLAPALKRHADGCGGGDAIRQPREHVRP